MTENLQSHIDRFVKEGYTVFRQALTPEQVRSVKEQVERTYEEVPDTEYGPLVRARMFERGGALLELTEAAPIVDFAEAMLGPNCHIIAMNALRTPQGVGVDSWHVDDELVFPLPDGVEWDERVQMPPLFFNCLYSLVDVNADNGPTQVVPGSHRSGRHPNATADSPPCHKGQKPISLLTKAGDCVVFSSQVWHRGARNESSDPRLVQGVTYGRRWVSQRFYPFVNYALPSHIVEALNPRQRRLLGLHERGSYG